MRFFMRTTSERLPRNDNVLFCSLSLRVFVAKTVITSSLRIEASPIIIRVDRRSAGRMRPKVHKLNFFMMITSSNLYKFKL